MTKIQRISQTFYWKAETKPKTEKQQAVTQQQKEQSEVTKSQELGEKESQFMSWVQPVEAAELGHVRSAIELRTPDA